MRRVAAGIGAVTATLVMALGASPASAQGDPSGLIPQGDWTQPQVDWMVGLIERTETTLPEHIPTTVTDGAELEAMGYSSIEAVTPGGYAHWGNSDLVDDEHFLNPEHPESLVYQLTATGVWELRAAMYMLPPEMEKPLPGLIGWLPGWHGHPELCINPDGTVASITDPNNPNCPPGTTQGLTPLMMHVWLEDPGCGHRFGGVGVLGLHCDVSH